MDNFRIFISSILAGIAFSIGGAAFLEFSNTSLITAAFLSAISIVAVLLFELKLFSAKAGYLFSEPTYTDKRISEFLISLAGNLIGVIAMGVLFTSAYKEKADAAVDAVLALSPGEVIIKSLICGMLMFITFHGFYRQKGSATGFFVAVMISMAYMLCGFNNALVDAFFYAAALRFDIDVAVMAVLAIVGNTVGALIFAELYEAKTSEERKKARRHHHHHEHHHSNRRDASENAEDDESNEE